MKTLLATAAAVIALTGPVFADTAADFATRHFAQSEEGGNGARLGTQASQGDVAAVIAHFAQDREGGDGPRVLIPSANDMIVSTSNSDLGSYAANLLANDERGYN